ncbi:NAD(P)-binding protein [Hypoxylon sp. FL0543]|nr:NAD(P)-binding protein [Hypoxylon sp. FL0543]
MASYLVTGANRGLGLEIVRVLANKPSSEVSTVFATLRSEPPSALQEIVSSSEGRVVLVQLETRDTKSISEAVDKVKQVVGDRGLDILINNAAINNETPEGVATMTNLRETLEVNVEAVQNLTVALLPLLKQGQRKTVLNMSSIVGSITLLERFLIAPHHAYKVSKAALNCLTKLYALDFDKEGFTFFAVSPGWVKTAQGGPYADLDADTAAKAVLDLLKRDRADLNGKFLNIHVPGWEKTTGLHNYDGAEIPW